jgi:Cu-Zn family superoxide dismutase
MNSLKSGAAGLGALVVAGCASYADIEPTVPPAPHTASAELRNAAGLSVGSATATQVGSDIRIRIDGVNLPMGAHGAHVHMTGICAPPAFDSAGGHWNPTGHKHGKDNPAGMHKGDLPNILIGADGRGMLEYTIPNARVTGDRLALIDSDGAALVIHANADDNRTDPSGNSGVRIACGAFR